MFPYDHLGVGAPYSEDSEHKQTGSKCLGLKLVLPFTTSVTMWKFFVITIFQLGIVAINVTISYDHYED